jgi:hypothetical protein
MIRAELAVAAIALVATVAVASAQAQTQTASLEPTIWDHNGSVMYLVANGPSREFHYQKPRAGMLEVWHSSSERAPLSRMDREGRPRQRPQNLFGRSTCRPIRRASSRVSNFAADRRPGSSSK